MDIYEKIETLLDERSMSRRQLAIKAGISPATLNSAFANRYKKFSYQMLTKVCSALDIEIWELIGDAEKDVVEYLSAQLKDTSSIAPFLKFPTMPSRALTIWHGDKNKLKDKYAILTEYKNCGLPYLFGADATYEPANDPGEKTADFSEAEAQTLVYDILDRCAKDKSFQIIQQQISRIIIYHLTQKGIGKDEVFKKCRFERKKLAFLYDIGNFDAIHWLTFTDLMRIRHEFSLSPTFLLTGKERWEQ
jgi:DNA-binding Xre family transcriptional regulator